MGDAAMTTPASTAPHLPERIRRTARLVWHEAIAAFERTPLEVLLGVCLAISFSIAVEWETMDVWARMLVAVGIGLPLSYAASALFVRGAIGMPVRWAISGLAVTLGAIYGFLVFDPELQAEAWRAALLVATAFTALLCVPAVRPDTADRRQATHRFIARFAARVALVAVYAFLLWIGLSTALATVNALFELHLDGKAFAHLASAVFILLPPWAVAAGLPALVGPIEPWREDHLQWFRRVGSLLVTPIVLVYLAIMYAYTVRVLVTGEVPKNLISPVVIGAGILIVAMTVALEPMHDDEKAGGLSWLVRAAAPALLPLVIFAGWAISSRVDQYGWTEFRYLRTLALILLGAFCIGAIWTLVRRGRPPLTMLPVVLAVVLLLAAVGPWSATAVSRRDQTSQLRELLAKAGVSQASTPAATIAPELFRGIVSKSEYLHQHFGWGAMRRVVPWVGDEPEYQKGPDILATRIGIAERPTSGEMRIVTARLPIELGIPGLIAGTMYPFDTHATEWAKQGRGGIRVAIDTAAARLTVMSARGDTLFADLRPLATALLDRSGQDPGSPVYGDRTRAAGEPPEIGRETNTDMRAGEGVVPLRDRSGALRGQLVVRTMAAKRDPAKNAGAPMLRWADGFMILGAGSGL